MCTYSVVQFSYFLVKIMSTEAASGVELSDPKVQAEMLEDALSKKDLDGVRRGRYELHQALVTFHGSEEVALADTSFDPLFARARVFVDER